MTLLRKAILWRDLRFWKDQLPPSGEFATTAIEIDCITAAEAGKVRVRGVTSDNGDVKEVPVNGTAAKALRPNFADWEVVLGEVRGQLKLTAHAKDAAGNTEKTPHVVTVNAPR